MHLKFFCSDPVGLKVTYIGSSEDLPEGVTILVDHGTGEFTIVPLSLNPTNEASLSIVFDQSGLFYGGIELSNPVSKFYTSVEVYLLIVIFVVLYVAVLIILFLIS